VPDITGSPAVDVAIGLIFLFFLLSLICSTVNEIIAGVLSWRARFLEDGIRSMLAGSGPQDAVSDLLDRVAEHPLIQGKVATPRKSEPKGLRGRVAKLRAKVVVRRRFPSYLNNKTFAMSLLDTIAPPVAGSQNDVLARAQAYAAQLPDGDPLKRNLLAFIDKARGDVKEFRASVESWFDLTMDRVSGWYKRRTQVSLIVIAAVVTLVFNADSLQIGRALWNDDAVRASVVAQAQHAIKEGTTEPDVGEGVSGSVDTLSDQVSNVKSLEFPLGWSTDPQDPRWFDSFWGFLGKVLGLLATVLALSLGAPFWFDLLGRVSRVRVTGKPEREGAQ
jgi:hypothetical protein